MNIRKTKYVIGAAFIAVGIAIVTASLLPKSMQYYVTVDELKAEENKFLGKELKVAGKVVPGSIKNPGELNWMFRVANAEKIVDVTYRGAMPDTFKEDADVVVTGTFDKRGHVQATQVLAKCASRYEEKLSPSYEAP